MTRGVPMLLLLTLSENINSVYSCMCMHCDEFCILYSRDDYEFVLCAVFTFVVDVFSLLM